MAKKLTDAEAAQAAFNRRSKALTKTRSGRDLSPGEEALLNDSSLLSEDPATTILTLGINRGLNRVMLAALLNMESTGRRKPPKP